LLNLKHETSSSFGRELDVLRNILVEVSFLFLTSFYLLKLYSAVSKLYYEVILFMEFYLIIN